MPQRLSGPGQVDVTKFALQHQRQSAASAEFDLLFRQRQVKSTRSSPTNTEEEERIGRMGCWADDCLSNMSSTRTMLPVVQAAVLAPELFFFQVQCCCWRPVVAATFM